MVFISNLAVQFKLFARRKLKDVGKLLVDVARGVVHHVIPGKLLDKFVQMRLFTYCARRRRTCFLSLIFYVKTRDCWRRFLRRVDHPAQKVFLRIFSLYLSSRISNYGVKKLLESAILWAIQKVVIHKKLQEFVIKSQLTRRWQCKFSFLSVIVMEFDRISLEAWQKEQPLSVLQLDTADRAVLRVAGRRKSFWSTWCFLSMSHSAGKE